MIRVTGIDEQGVENEFIKKTSPINTQDQSRLEVKLVRGTAQDGTSLEFCDTKEIPPRVQAGLDAIINDAKSRSEGEGWMKLIRSTVGCTYTALHGTRTHWIDGFRAKIGCKTCFNARQPCITLDKASNTFVVLPIREDARPEDAQPGEDRFYINLDQTLSSRDFKNDPWTFKPTRDRRKRGVEGEGTDECGGGRY